MNRKQKHLNIQNRIDKSILNGKIPNFIKIQKVAERASELGLLHILVQINEKKETITKNTRRKINKVDYRYQVALNAVLNNHINVVAWLALNFPGNTILLICRTAIQTGNYDVIEEIYTKVEFGIIKWYHQQIMNAVRFYKRLYMIPLILRIYQRHFDHPQYIKHLREPQLFRLHARLVELCFEANYRQGIINLEHWYFRLLPEKSLPVYLILWNSYIFSGEKDLAKRMKTRLIENRFDIPKNLESSFLTKINFTFYTMLDYCYTQTNIEERRHLVKTSNQMVLKRRNVAAKIIQEGCRFWIWKPICNDGTTGIRPRLDVFELFGVKI